MRTTIKSIGFCVLLLLPLISISAFGQHKETGDFNITEPHAYVRAEAGRELTIHWLNYSYSARNIFTVRIEIIKDSEIVRTVIESTANDGEYIDLLPADFVPGKYKIKITSTDETAISFSEQFEIILLIPIEITSPANNENLKQESTCVIRWSSDYPESKVYINLFKIGENKQLISRLNIGENLANKGEYEWRIPSDLEDAAYIIGLRIPPIANIKYSPPFIIGIIGQE